MAVEDPKKFANLTSWHIRYTDIYKLFKERAYQKKDSMLSENEYNTYIRNVTTGDNNDLFEQHVDEFRAIPLREWIGKVNELKTSASIKDANSIQEQLITLRRKYGDLPSGSRESFKKKDNRYEMTFIHANIEPNNKQFAIA